jgi:hypothetical protein
MSNSQSKGNNKINDIFGMCQSIMDNIYSIGFS